MWGSYKEMFYINRYLKAELTFSHYDMDKLSSDKDIHDKLRKHVEGRCHQDYGYLIQITKMAGTKSPLGIEISVPRVQSQGCVVTVTFNAITFKRTSRPTQPRRTTSSTSS